MESISVPSSKNGRNLKYHYDRVDLFTPEELHPLFPSINPGDSVTLVHDPDNPHDSNAVAAVSSVGKIGYLYRGKLQNMCLDYLRAGLPIVAHVDSIDDDEYKITIFMAFYGSTSLETSKTYKLVSSRNKKAQEALELVDPDDYLSVEYDPEKEKYLVYGMGEAAIGALPKSAEQFAEGYDCFAADVSEDEDGVYSISVRFEKAQPAPAPVSKPAPEAIPEPPKPVAPAPAPAFKPVPPLPSPQPPAQEKPRTTSAAKWVVVALAVALIIYFLVIGR